MTAPDPNVIEFTRIRAETLPIELEVCTRCWSVTLPMHRQQHADWHAKLTQGVKVLGMGFGGLGMSL